MFNKGMAYCGKIIDRYNADYGPKDIKHSRIVFFSLFLLLGFPDYGSVANNDPIWFNPPFLSPAFFWGEIPAKSILHVLSILTLISALFLIAGKWIKLSAIVFLIAFVTGTSFYYSFGKVDHSEIFVPIITFLLLINSLSKQKYFSTGSVYFMISFTIATAFFTAGITKLLSGWLIVDDQQLKYIIINYSIGLERGVLGPVLLENLQSKFIWEALDWMTVFFELSIFLFIQKPKWIRTIIILCIIFHLLNAYLISIFFKPIMLVYIFLIPTSLIWQKHQKWIIGYLFLLVFIVSLYQHKLTGGTDILNSVKSNYVWMWVTSLTYVFLYLLIENKIRFLAEND